jgi:hypothetical protein
LNFIFSKEDFTVKIDRNATTVPLPVGEGVLLYAASPANTEGYTRMLAELASALGCAAVCAGGEDQMRVKYLVGATARPEAAAAEGLLAGKKDAFAITADASCVVLLGTDVLMTLMAVQYFKENCLAAGEIPTATVVEDVERVTLADAKGCYATFVYGAQLYDKT